MPSSLAVMSPLAEHTVFRVLVDEERAVNERSSFLDVLDKLLANVHAAHRPRRLGVSATCLPCLQPVANHAEKGFRDFMDGRFMDWLLTGRYAEDVDEVRGVLHSEAAFEGVHKPIGLVRPGGDALGPTGAGPVVHRVPPPPHLLKDLAHDTRIALHNFGHFEGDRRPVLHELLLLNAGMVLG